MWKYLKKNFFPGDAFAKHFHTITAQTDLVVVRNSGAGASSDKVQAKGLDDLASIAGLELWTISISNTYDGTGSNLIKVKWSISCADDIEANDAPEVWNTESNDLKWRPGHFTVVYTLCYLHDNYLLEFCSICGNCYCLRLLYTHARWSKNPIKKCKFGNSESLKSTLYLKFLQKGLA